MKLRFFRCYPVKLTWKRPWESSPLILNKIIIGMNRLASILVFVSSLTVFSCKPKPTPPTPPVPVNLMTATARPVTYYDRYPATTVAISQVNLSAQVTGYITSINFTEGAHVHKGQLLYKLDERLYTAAVDQARAALRVDSGNLLLTQQDADRYAYLAKYKAIATQLVDHANISLQNAKDSVIAAQQQLKTAVTNLTYANIYAPFDGTIGISQVRIGNLVSPGTTILNTISTDNPVGVDFLVNGKRSCRISKSCRRAKENRSTPYLPSYCPTSSCILIPGRSCLLTGLLTRRQALSMSAWYSRTHSISCVRG